MPYEKLEKLHDLYLDMIARDGAPTEEDLEVADYYQSMQEEPNED